jgi:hypothetical protein
MLPSSLVNFASTVERDIQVTLDPSKRGYQTNNKYPEYPPIMHDGRAITAAWQPHSTENKKILEDNGIHSNWQYRQYLTKNAETVMHSNFLAASNDCGYVYKPTDLQSIQSNQISYKVNSPYLYSSTLDGSKPLGHSLSDLKANYLSREELQARQVSPVVTQDQLLQNRFQPKPQKKVQFQ